MTKEYQIYLDEFEIKYMRELLDRDRPTLYPKYSLENERLMHKINKVLDATDNTIDINVTERN